MRYLDEFDNNELLYYYMANNDLDWSDAYFRDNILEVAHKDLKKSEYMENYERCHEIVQFMEWVKERF